MAHFQPYFLSLRLLSSEIPLSFQLDHLPTSASSSMARTKHVVARHSAEEVPIESSSSSGEKIEMEVPPAEEHSEGSSAEETGEEASPR